MNNKANRLLFIPALLMLSSAFAQNADITILKKINSAETGFKNTYADLNDVCVNPLSIVVPAGIALAGFIKNDRKLKRDALYIGASYLTSALITLATKHAVNRKRPFADYPFIIRRADENTWLSFPSGHTSSAFCTATSLSLRYRKWYIIAPAYIFATSVAWARMYQGVHYPSDVLAGAIVGAGSAWLGYKAQKWISHKKERKKKVTL